MAYAQYHLDILRPGWSKSMDGGHSNAACTITLFKGPNTILIDPGSPWDTEKLRDLLKQRNLAFEDINYVICTHEHVDHIGSLHYFRNAVHIVGTTIYKDTYIDHDFAHHIAYEIDSGIKVVHTPGHSSHDVSVVAKNVEAHGRVAVVGDLFECEEDLRDPSLWQKSSCNPKLQLEYRTKILEKANFIVPGHGPAFKVTPEVRRLPLIALES
ncbi:hypothetical protein CRM22_011050 [Opisthorchis felineus]|uniref:Metallo-beta-lactamase domain-containing protein 1 n=1 Tax=Opisthorchis felineus TaxID=147828 RepID=A0A4V3SA18_OPIFE|nr:hypothetical protein CRM22_011050 [Opisthorchis felineus]